MMRPDGCAARHGFVETAVETGRGEHRLIGNPLKMDKYRIVLIRG